MNKHEVTTVKTNESETGISVFRNYRDTVFRKLFDSKKELLSLYNAVNGTQYDNPDDLEIVTLDNAIYMNMKNDLAFLIDFQLHLYEHQSTANPNMPLRFLQYVAREYEKLMKGSLLYRGRLVKIPAPHFVVFYNGTGRYPETKILRLSDAFQKKEEKPQLELEVQALNINHGNNQKLMEQCQILKEYTQYVERVRSYVSVMEIEDAIKRAVDECIKEGILSEFLLKNKSEVISMSIFEYDEEEVLALIRSDEREDGIAEGEIRGMAKAILKFLGELGELPETLKQQISTAQSLEVLERWVKLAAKSESIEQFMNDM